ncbi:Rz1-like lysis system protein LysC [Carnimonas bestiolae]|uniref:Rz1-like lysis system protein LysC n=1 Tax=Carnimonas bestiolae TaxID=3402172 RepID=UPI003F4ADA6D
MLSACSTTPPSTPVPIQQNLLHPCPEQLPLLTDGSGADIIQTMHRWAAEYHRCATRHNGLVDALQ